MKTVQIAAAQAHLPEPRIRAFDAVFGIAVLLVGATGLVSACRAHTEPASESAQTDASPASAEPVAAAAAAPTNPLVGLQTPDGESQFTAVVDQRIAAGGYTYLRLRTAEGDQHWLATMGHGSDPGQRVRVRSYGVRDNFVSRRTGRTFDRLLFGEVEPDA